MSLSEERPFHLRPQHKHDIKYKFHEKIGGHGHTLEFVKIELGAFVTLDQPFPSFLCSRHPSLVKAKLDVKRCQFRCLTAPRRYPQL